MGEKPGSWKIFKWGVWAEGDWDTSPFSPPKSFPASWLLQVSTSIPSKILSHSFPASQCASHNPLVTSFFESEREQAENEVLPLVYLLLLFVGAL